MIKAKKDPYNEEYIILKNKQLYPQNQQFNQGEYSFRTYLYKDYYKNKNYISELYQKNNLSIYQMEILKKEINIISQLPLNQYFLNIFEFIQTKTLICIVKESFQDSLYSYINFNQISKEMIIEIFIKVLDCVQFLDENNIFHPNLDIKDFSISNFNVKLMNLGLSKVDTQTNQYNDMKAPEILRKETIDASTNIYQVGQILYYMIYRKRISFSQSNYLLIDKQNHVIQFDDKQKNIPCDLLDLLKKMLQFQKEDRISMLELYQDPFMQKQMQKISDEAKIIQKNYQFYLNLHQQQFPDSYIVQILEENQPPPSWLEESIIQEPVLENNLEDSNQEPVQKNDKEESDIQAPVPVDTFNNFLVENFQENVQEEAKIQAPLDHYRQKAFSYYQEAKIQAPVETLDHYRQYKKAYQPHMQVLNEWENIDKLINDHIEKKQAFKFAIIKYTHQLINKFFDSIDKRNNIFKFKLEIFNKLHNNHEFKIFKKQVEKDREEINILNQKEIQKIYQENQEEFYGKYFDMVVEDQDFQNFYFKSLTQFAGLLKKYNIDNQLIGRLYENILKCQDHGIK